MPRFIRSVAFALALVVAALPSAALACQWTCAPGAAAAHHATVADASVHDTSSHATSSHGASSHHGSAHHPTTGASDAPAATPGGPALGVPVAACAHADGALTAVTSASLKLFAPAAVPVGAVVASAPSHATVAAARFIAHSPPAPPSRPLALRI